jgi:mannitol 2-dehydrogenase
MGKNDPRALLRHELFGDLRLVPGFVRELSELTEGIDAQGVVPVLRRYLWSDQRELMQR